jgi:hypothetical protein
VSGRDKSQDQSYGATYLGGPRRSTCGLAVDLDRRNAYSPTASITAHANLLDHPLRTSAMLVNVDEGSDGERPRSSAAHPHPASSARRR